MRELLNGRMEQTKHTWRRRPAKSWPDRKRHYCTDCTKWRNRRRTPDAANETCRGRRRTLSTFRFLHVRIVKKQSLRDLCFVVLIGVFVVFVACFVKVCWEERGAIKRTSCLVHYCVSRHSCRQSMQSVAGIDFDAHLKGESAWLEQMHTFRTFVCVYAAYFRCDNRVGLRVLFSALCRACCLCACIAGFVVRNLRPKASKVRLCNRVYSIMLHRGYKQYITSYGHELACKYKYSKSETARRSGYDYG